MKKRGFKKTRLSAPEEIKLLSQGAYGCIYRRGLDCFGKKELPQFITKIQKHKDNSDRETDIGKKIMTIPHSNSYFAPVLKSCPLVLAGIDSNEITQCDFLKNKDFQNHSYETNRIRYVGNLTYGDYLVDTFKQHPARFVLTFCELSKNILASLKKIAGKQIVHFDIKENNILIHDKTRKPVLIDFGLSFDVTDLKSGKMDLAEVFYAYDGFEVSYWTIDIAFCCYIDKLRRTKGAWKDELVTDEQIEDVIQNFFKYNPVFGEESRYQDAFTKEERNQYRTLHANMFRTEFSGKKWKDAVGILLNYAFSWDNYGLAVMNLSLLYELNLHTFPELQPFVAFFKSILLKPCNERPTCDATLGEFTRLLAGINNIGTPVLNKLRNLSGDSDFVAKQENNWKTSKLDNAKQEDKLYEKQGAAPAQGRDVPILVQ
jgi:serine/threonine protein kinase